MSETDRETVVRALSLGKRFTRLHQKPMLFRDLALLGRRRGVREDFWALRKVSFELRRGETVGVVGANGSGKSTLLTLLGGTSFPTEGSVSTRGRVSLLLDLGAGFHADMTGIENIMINSAIIGISPEQIRRSVDEIAAFAELEKAIDTPIRFYSSGMLARLGFAIAVHMRPDILLIDEVLAVGDAAFQAKCLAHLQALRRSEVTCLIVSHSTEAIRSICSRVLWIKEGHLMQDGAPDAVLAAFADSMRPPAG